MWGRGSLRRIVPLVLVVLCVGGATTRMAFASTVVQLAWDANTDADLAGYRIVWREHASAVWQHARDAGNVVRFTLPGLSKDHFLFGVQAIDRDGHASPAAFPKPWRP